jgi:hypothetical protein
MDCTGLVAAGTLTALAPSVGSILDAHDCYCRGSCRCCIAFATVLVAAAIGAASGSPSTWLGCGSRRPLLLWWHARPRDLKGLHHIAWWDVLAPATICFAGPYCLFVAPVVSGLPSTPAIIARCFRSSLPLPLLLWELIHRAFISPVISGCRMQLLVLRLHCSCLIRRLSPVRAHLLCF